MHRVDADNPWILSADSARLRLPGLLLALAACPFAFAVVFLARASAPRLVALINQTPPPWLYDEATLLVDLAAFGPLVVAAILGSWLEGRAAWRTGARPLLSSATGLVLGAAGFALSLLIASAAGAVVRGGTAPPSFALAAPVAVNSLLILLAAVAEELFFRGWIQPVLCRRWGAWVGLIAASALFALAHFAGGVRSPLAALNIFLAGLLFGLLALRTGGLLAPCAAHFAWNWSETVLFGSDPNPGAGPFGALIDLDLRGPSLWSGGADTMNGSLAATLVLLALFAGLVLAGPARARRTARVSRSAPVAGRRSGSAP